MATRRIEMRSCGNEIYEVSEEIAKQSVVIRNFLEVVENNGEKIVIPLPNVNGRMLRMVIEWTVKHADEHLTEKEVRDWETEFVNSLELDVIYELIMAANYLEVNGLLHCVCQKVADLITGKSPEEIRETFNIENDFSPEEEAEIRSQNAWVFDPSVRSRK